MTNVIFAAIPHYAAELLYHAAGVLAARDAPEHLPNAMAQLEQAVRKFEENMPVADGEIQTR